MQNKMVFIFLVLLGTVVTADQWSYGGEDWETTSANIGSLTELFEPNATRNDTAKKRFLYGFQLMMMENHANGHEQYMKALEADPNFMMPYFGKIMLYRYAFRYNEGPGGGLQELKSIENSTDKLSQREKHYFEAARLLYENYETDSAKIRLERHAMKMKAISKLYENDFMAQLLAAKAFVELGRDDKSYLDMGKNMLKEILKDHPKNAIALYIMLVAYNAPGDAGQAIAAAREMEFGYDENKTPFSLATVHLRRAYIFSRVGDWKNCHEAATYGWTAQRKWANTHVDFEYGARFLVLEARHYCALQLGKFEAAKQYIGYMRRDVERGEALDNSSWPLADDDKNFFYSLWYRMAARQILDTRNYDLENKNLVDINLSDPPYRKINHTNILGFYTSYSEIAFLLVRYYQAKTSKFDNATDIFNNGRGRITEIKNEVAKQAVPSWNYVILYNEVLEKQFLAMKDMDSSVLWEAAKIEDRIKINHLDPQFPIIPSWEMYADWYRGDEPNDGGEMVYYFKSLNKYPNRAMTVYGIARAYRDRHRIVNFGSEKFEWYQKAYKNWETADTEFDALEEVEEEKEVDNPWWAKWAIVGVSLFALVVAIIIMVIIADLKVKKKKKVARDDVDAVKMRYNSPYGFQSKSRSSGPPGTPTHRDTYLEPTPAGPRTSELSETDSPQGRPLSEMSAVSGSSYQYENAAYVSENISHPSGGMDKSPQDVEVTISPLSE